ncbi:sensor histidine kinase [Roseisolibacter agri]|uniref:histidine kinase n=1 Tax=Roseisolibacter agri TaxID=2014610 RepID=A0AA37Q2T4_9BACT|nr:GAF domain-containing sensor histidine kinase [Roseisolibacter agri]GLC23557.1 hypothetical protein rosag_00700 [Roseisolibacter agri]
MADIQVERVRVSGDASQAAAMQVAHVSVDRLRGLLAISAALARAFTALEVAEAVARHAVPVVGASSSIVALVSADGRWLERIGLGGFPADVRADWERSPIEQPLPVADAVRTGAPVLLTSRAEMVERYPDTASLWSRVGAHALATFPLASDARPFGAIAFRFSEPRTFRSDDDLEFLQAVAQQCAVALERARLFDAERLARAAAEEARREADEANRAKSEFLARMSHELRTPLNAIGGHLQLVEMGIHGPVTDAQREAFDRVARAQRHLLGLINDVLNLARLESGRVEFALEPTRVLDVLADVRPMVEPQLAAKGIAFEVSLPDDAGAGIPVWADREKLVQVLLNLLDNAVKFTAPGGRVVLEFGARPRHPHEAIVRVHDTGVGIPADRLAAVFEPFVQVSTGLTRAHQGTGLGLAISRDLARGMGGELSAESALGAGSTFTLVLRRTHAPDGQAIDRRSGAPRRGSSERRRRGDRRGETRGRREPPSPRPGSELW